MLIDKSLEFSDKQVVTATANGTTVVDLMLDKDGVVRDIGHGTPLYVISHVVSTFSDVGSDSTVTVALVTSATSDLASPTTLATLGVFPALAVAGTRLQYALPVGLAYKEFLGITYTVANGNLTTGTITTYLSEFPAPASKTFYPSGIPV